METVLSHCVVRTGDWYILFQPFNHDEFQKIVFTTYRVLRTSCTRTYEMRVISEISQILTKGSSIRYQFYQPFLEKSPQSPICFSHPVLNVLRDGVEFL